MASDEVFQHTLSLSRELTPETAGCFTAAMNRLASFHLHRYEYQAARYYWLLAKRAARQIEAEDNPEYLLALSIGAVVEFKNNNVSEAQYLYQECKELIPAISTIHGCVIAEVMTNCFYYLALSRQNDEAAMILKKAIGTAKNIFGPEHPTFIRMLELEGDFNTDIGNLKAAVCSYTKARHYISQTGAGQASNEDKIVDKLNKAKQNQ